jgi:hypothetical protein
MLGLVKYTLGTVLVTKQILGNVCIYPGRQLPFQPNYLYPGLTTDHTHIIMKVSL